MLLKDCYSVFRDPLQRNQSQMILTSLSWISSRLVHCIMNAISIKRLLPLFQAEARPVPTDSPLGWPISEASENG